MTRCEDYREKAEGCLRAAQGLRDPGERMTLLAVARGYLALARHVGAREENGTAYHRPAYDPAPRQHDA